MDLFPLTLIYQSWLGVISSKYRIEPSPSNVIYCLHYSEFVGNIHWVTWLPMSVLLCMTYMTYMYVWLRFAFEIIHINSAMKHKRLEAGLDWKLDYIILCSETKLWICSQKTYSFPDALINTVYHRFQVLHLIRLQLRVWSSKTLVYFKPFQTPTHGCLKNWHFRQQ